MPRQLLSIAQMYDLFPAGCFTAVTDAFVRANSSIVSLCLISANARWKHTQPQVEQAHADHLFSFPTRQLTQTGFGAFSAAALWDARSKRRHREVLLRVEMFEPIELCAKTKASGGALGYVAVRGKVACDSPLSTSLATPTVSCVIQQLEVVEHRAEYKSGTWRTKYIPASRSNQSCPFNLVASSLFCCLHPLSSSPFPVFSSARGHLHTCSRPHVFSSTHMFSSARVPSTHVLVRTWSLPHMFSSAPVGLHGVHEFGRPHLWPQFQYDVVCVA
jgi:hypothetical protein